MSSISAVIPQVTIPGTNIPVKAASADAGDTRSGGTAAAASGGRAAGIRTGGGAAMAAGAGGSSDDDSTGSDTVKQLKKQIAELQKQLAEQQRQLQAVQASNMNDEAKTAVLAAAQSQVSSTSASLLLATSALAQALEADGGSASGSLVKTTA
ncbi:hypothetical protein [Cupriavidus sp.]|uniref:hypothetical protein n=1 Tax=Cupriavidus sp. TaxID=1873897 RepID=UPI003D14D5A0